MLRADVGVSENRDAPSAVRRGVRKQVRDAAAAGFQKSQELVPVDRGTLLQSGVPPQELPDGSWIYGYNAEHAEYVERGTEPHWAPIDPLKGWAQRVLGDERAAYGVQAKIAQQGTEAQPFMRPSVDVVRAHLRGTDLDVSIREEL